MDQTFPFYLTYEDLKPIVQDAEEYDFSTLAGQVEVPQVVRGQKHLLHGKKLHMQSLGALAHISYQEPGVCGYELAVNQDDHVKNISFIMDRTGKWRLSPAYDITFSYNPSNKWLRAHQMTINGKTTEIKKSDLLDAGAKMIKI